MFSESGIGRELFCPTSIFNESGVSSISIVLVTPVLYKRFVSNLTRYICYFVSKNREDVISRIFETGVVLIKRMCVDLCQGRMQWWRPG